MWGWARERWWTAQRFGLTPASAWRRIRGSDAPRILCITIPKSGTHLLERALCLHPALHRARLPTIHEGNLQDHGGLRTMLPCLRPGQVLLAHLPYQPHFDDAVRSHDVRSLLLVRDPRDVAVSEAHYALARPDVPGHAAVAAEPDLAGRIRVVIEGRDGELAPLADRLRRFVGWLESGARLVRFEDLVGPEGGGDLERQCDTLRDVFAHIGLPVTGNELGRLRNRLFSAASPTFRRGRTGGWRDDFTPEIDALFLERAGPLLGTFGYAGDPPRTPS